MPLSSDPGDFKDPLENYEEATYDDALEQALAEQKVSVVKSIPVHKVTPDTPIAEAVEMLADMHGSCLLVENEGRLVGVFTDRDVVDKVALRYEDVRTRPVSSVMTFDPVYIYHTDSLAAALTVMAVSGYRYVPVLEKDGTIQGIVTPQRVTAYLRRVFDAG